MADLVSDADVIAAHRRGRMVIEIVPGTIVTQQARDTAARLGVSLHEGLLERPQAPRTDGNVSLRRNLWRRNPGWISPLNKPTPRARRIKKLALIGAGGVGANIAHLVCNAHSADLVCLIDVVPGLAESVALDLEHATGVNRSATRVSGGESLQAVAGAEVVVVTAGRPRTPGMGRSDLLDINRRVIRTAAQAISEHAPEAIVIVVTNPLDEMTVEMLRATGFPRQRVLGMAGTLDSSRFRRALAKEAGVAVADVEAITLGSHGDEMTPITSRARIRGRTLETVLSQEQIDACAKDAVTGGGQVVALRKTGSATVAPAHSTVELIDHIRGALNGAVPVSVMLEGEYGITGVVLGVPCLIGASGVLEVEELALNESESQMLHAAAQAITERLNDA